MRYRDKQSEMWKHFKTKKKRGETFVTHSDSVTFTMCKDSSVIRLVDNDLDWESMTPRNIRRFYKDRAGAERWKGYSKVNVTAPVHFFKTYYGRVDAINSILAIFGMDRKTRRKTFRVQSQISSCMRK